jgi:hypothetical protein
MYRGSHQGSVECRSTAKETDGSMERAMHLQKMEQEGALVDIWPKCRSFPSMESNSAAYMYALGEVS